MEATVSKALDLRKSKKADNTIIKLRNQRTVAVVEVKMSVNSTLTIDDQAKLAQLFYEVKLMCQYEKLDKDGTQPRMVAIYANQDLWHFFLIKYGSPFQILNHTLVNEVTVSVVLCHLRAYIALI